MSEKDVIDLYARELKLAAVRENVSLFAEDALREQWGHLTFLRRLLRRRLPDDVRGARLHAFTGLISRR